MPKITNLIGNEYGKLIVTAKSERKDTGGKTMYECDCECGGQITVRGTNLTTKRVTSCGCNKSVGELNITKLLIANGKTYAREYTFTNLIDIKKLRYDFAVMTENNELDYLIEFDGIQHTIATEEGWNTEENLRLTKERDKKKNEYAKQNGITLIRIPYTERDNITIEMITPETSAYKM